MQTAYIYDDVRRCASRFTGKERDTETGLDYFGARYYASNMGRWMSPDWSSSPEAVPYAKLPDPQTLNLYGYLRNDPLNTTDLDGHGDAMTFCQQASCKFAPVSKTNAKASFSTPPAPSTPKPPSPPPCALDKKGC